MTASSRIVLRAFALWTVYVWGTRMWNIAQDTTTSSAFKIVHGMLALVSVAFAVATWVIVRRTPKT
ncbi:MAG TPA: hypothetical protein VM143_12600 [Acidimicrobiales bacterium]|nr:hypothetical protein [Acidimicrobiales bacterium]